MMRKTKDERVRTKGRRRGLTLVELLVSVAILAVMSTAVLSMVFAGAKVNTALNNSVQNQWELDTTVARMLNVTRTASSVSVPSGTSSGTTYSLVSQPDAANANTTYAISYSLVTLANGTKVLQETDSRYGTNTLIRDVQTFDVRLKNLGDPTVLIITLTVGKGPTTTRTFRVTPRNL